MNLTSLASAITPLDLRSCLISHRNQLIFEHYRDQHISNEIAKINSCTKSILSALICIAMDQGLLPQPQTRITSFFPQLANDPDPRKQEITLQHLLTMTAGFNWTEFGGQKSFPRMTRSSNWVDFVLEQQLSDSPGTRMEYNSGVSQLLSAILVQVIGMSTARYAELYLFKPLGIESYQWESDPQGIHTGGYGLRLLPSDMLKFGQLYLDHGKWNNGQLISKELITRSVQPSIAVDAPRRGLYAWHWWADSFLDTVNDSGSGGTSFEYFYARGYGGQFIHVIPSLDTVVVLTNDKRKKEQHPGDVFHEYIAPLLVK
ncbi:serine hydrolase domain-containing protein [Paenibacillus pini]|uniref:Beta-lactamase class C and other penicillin binding proteins n=1 Tax=Paenibacillus pini JCM 16418 TaxID=1236976 RepID=W7YNC5_9BACL|nr:serine hydrolase [Paenibacillus pini]GAF09947.1 beta-lactamase class C and other penicillin binding proteins [Paenibacillus pini JCM 16418]